MQVNSLTAPIANSHAQSSNKSIEEQKAKSEIIPKPDMSLNARVASMIFASGENTSSNASAQSSLFSMVDSKQEMNDFLMGIEKEGAFSLSDLGYDGKPILELNADEASDLLSAGGFFSVENTASRAAAFVVDTAGDDLSMLKAGREGIVKGFADAEKAWGGKLPDIAYDTQKLTLEKIDMKIQSIGGNALDVAA